MDRADSLEKVREVWVPQGIQTLRIPETNLSQQKTPESFLRPAFSMSCRNSSTSPSVALSLLIPSAGGQWGWEPQLCEQSIPWHQADGGDIPVPAPAQIVAPGLTCGQFPACPWSCAGVLSMAVTPQSQPGHSSTSTAIKLVLIRGQGEPSPALSDPSGAQGVTPLQAFIKLKSKCEFIHLRSKCELTYPSSRLGREE